MRKQFFLSSLFIVFTLNCFSQQASVSLETINSSSQDYLIIEDGTGDIYKVNNHALNPNLEITQNVVFKVINNYPQGESNEVRIISFIRENDTYNLNGNNGLHVGRFLNLASNNVDHYTVK